MRLRAVRVALVTAVAACVAVPMVALLPLTGASGAPVTSGLVPTIYTKAIADALAARSFHEYSSVTSSGYVSSGTEDAIRMGGVAVDRIRTPSSTFGFATRLIGSRLYLDADQLTLEDIVGLSAFDGGFNAGHWLVVPTTSKDFNILAYGMNVATGIDQIELGDPITAPVATTYDKVPAELVTSTTGLHASQSNGTQAGEFALYISTGSHPLPIAEVIIDTIGTISQKVTITFSRWNAAVSVAKPSPTRALP